MEYTTVIEPVLEVTLAGTADSAPWHELLRAEGLVPASGGQIAVLLSAVDAKYKGIRFQELSISVQVSDQRYFLAHAYNSIGLFALAERKFFQTPYYKGRISLHPHHLSLHEGSQPLFEASLPADTAFAEQQQCHQLVIHLPKALRPDPKQPHYFHARLEGSTKIYSGEAARLNITPRQPIWELLHSSHFRVQQWTVREAARHSKSKTFQGAIQPITA